MRIVLVLGTLCTFPVLTRADAPNVVPAAEAGRHVDEVVTVEMPVRSTGSSRKEGFVFLNSQENFRSNDNFTLVFTPAAQAAFRSAGIDNIEKHYFRQLIRVTGKVRHFKSVTDIQVERPDQITVVGPAPDAPRVAGGKNGAAPPESATVGPADSSPGSGTTTTSPLVYGAFGLFGIGLLVFGASRLLRPGANRVADGAGAPPVGSGPAA